MIHLRRFTIAILSALIPQTAFAEPPVSLSWSDNPGAFEQHLQRRNNNPLFPPNRRIVKQADIGAATARDQRDYQALIARRVRLLEDTLRLPDIVSPSQINELRERVEELIRDAVGVGGPAFQLAERMKEHRQRLIESWREALSGNAEALRRLDEADEHWHTGAAIFDSPFIAQMTRKDGPIPSGDAIPALLSEKPQTIATAMSLFKDPQKKAIIQAEAASILSTALKSGATIDRLEEKLQALGISVK